MKKESVMKKDSMFNLPRKYLSYSAINLWHKNKGQFRQRYYENKKPPQTKYTIFGYEAEQQVYEGKLSGVPCWSEQHKLETEIEGIPIMGYLDTFDVENKKFADYKSSLYAWTQVDVEALDQLPFYSLLIERIYGNVDPVCILVWLETELVSSNTLLSNGDELRLTGEFEVFEREIEPWERERMVPYIRNAAEEISEDYTNWLHGVENPPSIGMSA